MKRYRIVRMGFDARAVLLDLEIDENWEDHIKQLWRENKDGLIRELQAEFGPHNLDEKIQNIRDLGTTPFSVLAYHNRFLREARNSFIIGSYFPALTGTGALGERILNHLIHALRESYRRTSEYKRVYRKDSFDDWAKAIEVLEAWNVFLPGVADLYRQLHTKRNDSLHFRPETDTSARQLALEAIKLLERIISAQFGAFGDKPWFIEDTPGVTFIKKDYENVPFVQKVVLPNAVRVGPKHEVEVTGSGIQVKDDDSEDEEGTDEDFVREWRSTPDAPTAS